MNDSVALGRKQQVLINAADMQVQLRSVTHYVVSKGERKFKDHDASLQLRKMLNYRISHRQLFCISACLSLSKHG